MIDHPSGERGTAGARRAGLLVAGGRPAGLPLAGLVLAGLLLAGCAGTPAPGTAGSAGEQAPTTVQAAGPDAVALPWPAAGAAESAALQAAVDGGSQPWLLDPTEVARAYVAAAHGWADATARPTPDSTRVEVSNGNGETLILSLAQPGRPDAAGIWVVVTEQPN